MSVEHYENFPVASWLCPPRIRPAVVAIYHFARTADDIADEGNATAAQRLDALARYRASLSAAVAGEPPRGEHARIFGPLAAAIREFDLPARLLHDLLDAFEQDTGNPAYPDRAALLEYCRRSANPVGRLLLHLHGVSDGISLARSDAICSALQLINFWQDLSVDGPRGRVYVPASDRERHGVALEDLLSCRDSAPARAMVRELVSWARTLMNEGAPLALTLPGRAGWELRGVVQGGLRIAEKISAMDHASLGVRPKLGAADVALLAWRSLRMRREPATGRSRA